MFYMFSLDWTNMVHLKGCIAVMLLTSSLCISNVCAASRTVVFEGNSAELDCEVEGAVITIYWQKGEDLATATTVASFVDGTRQGSDGDRISMSPSRSLVINDVRIDDESQYFCVVMLTSSTNEVVIQTELVIAVPPAEPYPTIVLLEPTSSPSSNASCQYTIPQGTQYRLSCQVASFRPSVQLLWFVDNASEGGSPMKYADNEDGTKDVYGSLDVTMGNANMEVRCEVSGEAVPAPPRTTTALVCWTPSAGGGGSNTTTIIVIVVIVFVLIAAVIGIALWMRILIKDTMVRSSYSKTVSADDDTPSRSRLSNFCHICCATCCPCTVKDDDVDAETQRRRKPSSSDDERVKKQKAPSAALKARIQQNRKKQDGKPGVTAADSIQVPSDNAHEHSPMLEDPINTSTPANPKPPGARPKTRPIDDASVVIRVPHQAPQSRGHTNGTASGEVETGF